MLKKNPLERPPAGLLGPHDACGLRDFKAG
jgi:hypothetical protein